MSDIMDNTLAKTLIAHDAISALRDMVFETPLTKIVAERLPVFEALALYAPQLSALSKRALVPNLVHDASILTPALKFLENQPQGLEVIMAWQTISDATGSPSDTRRLVGWLVVHRAKSLPGIGFSYLKNWHHLYSYMGHPIVDRDHAEAALSALFEQALAKPGTPGRLMMSNVPGSGPIYEAIAQVIKKNKLLTQEMGRYERAAMITDLDAEAYLKSTLSTKKRKEYRRLKNRLEDMGCLKFETCQTEEECSSWVEGFMELEVAGWKGRKKTAFNSRQDWSTFLKVSTKNLFENGNCKIWRLTLDGKTIAITIAHYAGHQAWLTKIAYDEAYAKYSPGVLLVLDVTRAIIEDPEITEIDSLATPDHPMINHLWREKISTTDILISINKPVAKTAFAMTCRLIEARRWLRAKAKEYYYRYLKGASR